MTKYRIVTEPGTYIDTVYVLQKKSFLLWSRIESYTDLDKAKSDMDYLIKHRDFKSEVIRSE